MGLSFAHFSSSKNLLPYDCIRAGIISQESMHLVQGICVVALL